MKTVAKINQLVFCAFAACLMAASSAPYAQGYPTKPIRLVVPSVPGGGTDITARLIAPKLSEFLGQPVFIENRGGAGGSIGAHEVSKAAPDGYTVVMAIASLTINPFVRTSVPFDIAKDLAPVSLVAKVPNILVSHPSLPARSIQELIAFLKAHPGQYSYASSGVGSTPHLGMELFLSTNGLKMVHVPYKGVGAAVVDVMAGHVPIMMANVLSALPHIKSGKLRAYGVTSLKRVAIAPDFPTIAEAGVPGFEVVPWFGLMAPANTPREIIARLHAGTLHALQDPATKQHFVSEGAEAVGSTPEEFAAVIRDDLDRWSKVTKQAGIKPE